MTKFHGDIFRGKRTLQKNFATLAPRPRFVAFEHFVVNHRIATLAPGRVRPYKIKPPPNLTN
jgi:hypothetical protein